MSEQEAPRASVEKKQARIVLVMQALGYILGILILLQLLFILWIWPDWDAWRQGKIPASAVIQDYLEAREDDPKLPPLQWKPIEKQVPKQIVRAFILSEDSRFYEHHGFDWEAIADAMAYNWQHKKIKRGASTISQQTAKNMFLSLSRNPLRKLQELPLTYLLEGKLSKNEILHVYLNVAEFGKGIFGIEAAAKAYYRVSAHQLTPRQAAELAASLPSPKKHNPLTRTRNFQKHVARLSRTMQIVEHAHASNQPDSVLISAELARKLQELRELSAEEEEKVAKPEESTRSDPSPQQPVNPSEPSQTEEKEEAENETVLESSPASDEKKEESLTPDDEDMDSL